MDSRRQRCSLHQDECRGLAAEVDDATLKLVDKNTWIKSQMTEKDISS
jgi:hypothetical protein